MDKPTRYMIVRLPPQEKAVYFVVPSVADDDDLAEFMVDENSCPKNWLRDIEEIILDGDTDPHGLIEYVRSIDPPEFLGRAHSPGEEWKKLIPEAFSDKE